MLKSLKTYRFDSLICHLMKLILVRNKGARVTLILDTDTDHADARVRLDTDTNHADCKCYLSIMYAEARVINCFQALLHANFVIFKKRHDSPKRPHTK